MPIVRAAYATQPVPRGRPHVSFSPLASTLTRISLRRVHSLSELFESNRASAARITAQVT